MVSTDLTSVVLYEMRSHQFDFHLEELDFVAILLVIKVECTFAFPLYFFSCVFDSIIER
jgi:hypothetical protein